MKLLLLNRYFRGGQTTHVHSLADALAENGHSVVLAYLDQHFPDELWKSRPRRVDIQWIRGEQQLSTIYDGRKPDLIHAHSQHTWDLGGRLASRFRIPYVVTCHRRGLSTPRFIGALSAATRVIAPGPKTAASLSNILPDKIAIVANGVDTQFFAPGAKPSRPMIAYVGRVDRTRMLGFNAFLSATQGLDADVVFLGSLPRGWSIPDHVHHLGWQTELQNILGRTDVVVGVGRSLMEGLASGAAGIVLGEKLHGLVSPERIASLKANGRPLFLTELPSSTPDRFGRDLRETLESLVRSQERLRNLQSFSRKLACLHFDVRDRVSEIVRLYEQSVAGAPCFGCMAERAFARSEDGDEMALSTSNDNHALLRQIEHQRLLLDATLSRPARWRGGLRRDYAGKEHDERRNRVAKTFNELVGLIDRGDPPPLNLALIRRVYRHAVGGDTFRTQSVRIARYRDFASPERIPILLGELIAQVESSKAAAPLRAAWMHLGLVRIHPFSDGNGRTARLLSSYVLLRAGYRSTLFTIVEQHFGEHPDDYVRVMSLLRPGPVNSICVRRLLQAMADHSRLASWFREREHRLRACCKAVGVTGDRQERLLERFDLGLSDSGPFKDCLRNREERPWSEIRRTWDAQGLRALHYQLERIRSEEGARRNRIRSRSNAGSGHA